MWNLDVVMLVIKCEYVLSIILEALWGGLTLEAFGALIITSLVEGSKINDSVP